MTILFIATILVAVFFAIAFTWITKKYKYLQKELDRQIEGKTLYIKQAKAHERDIERIINSMEDGFMLVDKDCNVLLYNKQSLVALRLKKLRLGHNIKHVYRAEQFIVAMNEAESRPQSVDIAKAGVVYRFNISRVSDGFVIFTKNVTSQVALAAKQKHLTANLSHALKTPLTAISGFAEILSAGLVVDEQKILDYSKKIYDQTRRLIALAEDIMRLSEIEDSLEKVSENIEIIPAINLVLEILASAVAEKNISVGIKGAGIISMHRGHFIEIMQNILDNAIKYNIFGGHIEIDIQSKTDVIITIKDTGAGIADADAPHIFDRFYRSAQTHVAGNGLGLSIAKNILALYGGKISLKPNAPNDPPGAEFSICLPKPPTA